MTGMGEDLVPLGSLDFGFGSLCDVNELVSDNVQEECGAYDPGGPGYHSTEDTSHPFLFKNVPQCGQCCGKLWPGTWLQGGLHPGLDGVCSAGVVLLAVQSLPTGRDLASKPQQARLGMQRTLPPFLTLQMHMLSACKLPVCTWGCRLSPTMPCGRCS